MPTPHLNPLPPQHWPNNTAAAKHMSRATPPVCSWPVNTGAEADRPVKPRTVCIKELALLNILIEMLMVRYKHCASIWQGCTLARPWSSSSRIQSSSGLQLTLRGDTARSRLTLCFVLSFHKLCLTFLKLHHCWAMCQLICTLPDGSWANFAKVCSVPQRYSLSFSLFSHVMILIFGCISTYFTS